MPRAFTRALKACAADAAAAGLRRGRILHKLAVDRGLASHLFVSNALISMYAKCGSLRDAFAVFEGMPERDVVSWNSAIAAFAGEGFVSDAVDMVRTMMDSGIRPDRVTVVTILTLLCGGGTVGVEQVHGYALRMGFDDAAVIVNSLISSFCKCGKVDMAKRVFANAQNKGRVAWNAMIAGYAQHGRFEDSKDLLEEMKRQGMAADVVAYSGIISSLSQKDRSVEAVELFKEMVVEAQLQPDVVAMASVLPAVSRIPCFNYCREIHGYSARHCLDSDRRVGNALVAVYSKLNSVRCARRVFSAIRDRDVISWSSMVAGYSQNLYFLQALQVFKQMISARVKPNPISIASALSACAGISGLRLGQELHQWAVKNSFKGQQIFVGSAMVDMYAKCGMLKYARTVFDYMVEEDKSLVTYNVMIGSYAIHGQADQALKLFSAVERPDQLTFLAALSACSHGGGLVEQGIQIFNSMGEYGVESQDSHRACVVDLLARAGRLEEASNVVATMAEKPSEDQCGALLAACMVHRKLSTGLQVEGSWNSGHHVLLSNIMADHGRWEEVMVVRKTMQNKGIQRHPALTWTEPGRMPR